MIETIITSLPNVDESGVKSRELLKIERDMKFARTNDDTARVKLRPSVSRPDGGFNLENCMWYGKVLRKCTQKKRYTPDPHERILEGKF
ncbi:hypothetical protein EG68_11419 [Paragonimus skrjabini miyazakii]|uniref:Uncharacterized protein n=1 Tax=Paragonimus skrjabini miyazakii TaxID=59628 RepID=A0A8S9YE63_9TREM|nr:hypothetical protein EG68_11419 [Paragonimus skrjabini miyazakii]